jgi:hypothetical protein
MRLHIRAFFCRIRLGCGGWAHLQCSNLAPYSIGSRFFLDNVCTKLFLILSFLLLMRFLVSALVLRRFLPRTTAIP